MAITPLNWRFQVRWLQNPDFVKFIQKKIDHYFELNVDQTSASIRWVGFKAYIREEIISFTSTKNKQHKKQMVTLDKQIKSLELDLYTRDDPIKQNDLLRLRTEYNKLSSDAGAKSLMWLKQSHYDQGEKAGKLLAWRIKKMQSSIKIYTNQDVFKFQKNETHSLINSNRRCKKKKRIRQESDY